MGYAGKYRHYITIQIKSLSKNTYNEDEITWRNDFDSYANVKPIRGRDFAFSHQINADISHKIEMRYNLLSDGTRMKPSNCRIIFHDNNEDRTFVVHSIIDINERHKDLEIMCTEDL